MRWLLVGGRMYSRPCDAAKKIKFGNKKKMEKIFESACS